MEEDYASCAVTLSNDLAAKRVQLTRIHAERVFPQAVEGYCGLATCDPSRPCTITVVDVVLDLAVGRGRGAAATANRRLRGSEEGRAVIGCYCLCFWRRVKGRAAVLWRTLANVTATATRAGHAVLDLDQLVGRIPAIALAGTILARASIGGQHVAVSARAIAGAADDDWEVWARCHYELYPDGWNFYLSLDT